MNPFLFSFFKDFLCDRPKYAIIQNWMRNRNTVELLGFWETIYNPNFKPLEFEGFKKQAGLNSFVMTPKRWIETTHAIGMVSKAGRYGETFAHKDIALEFASWISIEFKLYVIKEFQRLNEQVLRNSTRFPADFIFQLTEEEFESLKSQIAMSKTGRGGRTWYNTFRPHSFPITFLKA